MCVLLCEVLLAGSSAVVRAVQVAGGAGGGLSWRVLACKGGASRQSRVLGARGASRRGGDGPPFSVTWTFSRRLPGTVHLQAPGVQLHRSPWARMAWGVLQWQMSLAPTDLA